MRYLPCTKIPSRCRRDVLGIKFHPIENDPRCFHHIVAHAVAGHPRNSVFSHRKATLSVGVSTRKWWSTRTACVATLSKEANQTNVLARTRSERQIHRWFFAAYRNNERPVGRRRVAVQVTWMCSSSDFACAQRSERDNRSTLAASASAFSKEANQTTTSSPSRTGNAG